MFADSGLVTGGAITAVVAALCAAIATTAAALIGKKTKEREAAIAAHADEQKTQFSALEFGQQVFERSVAKTEEANSLLRQDLIAAEKKIDALQAENETLRRDLRRSEAHCDERIEALQREMRGKLHGGKPNE